MINLATGKMPMLAKGRNIDGYHSISREQLEGLFSTSNIPTPISTIRPTPMPRPRLITASRRRLTLVPRPRPTTPNTNESETRN